MDLGKTTEALASNFQALTQTSKRQGILFWPGAVVLGTLVPPILVVLRAPDAVYLAALVVSLMPLGASLVVFLLVIVWTSRKNQEITWISERVTLEAMKHGLLGTRQHALPASPVVGRALADPELRAKLAQIPEENFSEAAKDYEDGKAS